MLEINFRGKRISFGPSDWVSGNGVYLDGKSAYIIKDEKLNGIVRVDSNTVGQYTGERDEQGHQIYVGDIVEFSDRSPYNKRERATIIQEDGGFYGLCSVSGEMLRFSRMKNKLIVGNIYDNPEERFLKSDLSTENS